MTAYATRPEHIAIHPAGWVRLSSGVEITCLPLLDTGGRGPLFCRGSERARRWLAERGLRLASVESLRELHQICGRGGVGIHIAPYTLPDLEMQRAGAVPGDPRMSSVEWCTRHDVEVMRRLELAGWDGQQPADNVGKHIAADGTILGWEDTDGEPEHQWIQPRSWAHVGHEQLDYATLVHAERDAGTARQPGSDVVFTPAPQRRTLRVSRPLMQGSDVRDVQQAVEAKPDGWYGPLTGAAVVRWQAARGLVADGIVGPRTWEAIDGAPRHAETPAPVELVEAYTLVRAKNYTWDSRRPGALTGAHMATVHTIQCPPRGGYALGNARWFASSSAPSASIHWWVDSGAIVQGLEERHLAWGAKSGPERHAQRYGVHVEHAGYTADPSRGIVATDWLGEGLAVVERGARLMAAIVARNDLLPERVDVPRMAAWRDALRRGDVEGAWRLRGICGHREWTLAYNVLGGHGDPGTWPWPEYLEMVRSHL